MKNFSSKCDQIRMKLRILSHLLEKSLMENVIFCAVSVVSLLLFEKKKRFLYYKIKTTKLGMQKTT